MWNNISGFLIRQRIAIIVVMGIITAFMAYEATKVELSYEFPQIVPQSDPDYVFYRNFKDSFGEDGNIITVGFSEKDVFTLDVLNDWCKLARDLDSVPGVDTVVSIASLPWVEKNTEEKRFVMRPLISHLPRTQTQADSIKKELLNLPFYKHLLYNEKTHATLLAIRVKQKTLVSKDRVALINNTRRLGDSFAVRHGLTAHYSGLPYIRTIFAQKIQKELNLFLALSVIVTALILLVFFRSIYNVIFPLIIIIVILIWTLGIIVLYGYKITLLSALIPPLVVIIGIPNFIYFLNNYHQEYKKNRKKILAITRMVNNIAQVVFLNNTTTAIGFGVLFFVDSPILNEFGTIAFTMIVLTYVITLMLMPAVFSMLPDPKTRHLHYLENPIMRRFLNVINALAQNNRKKVYAISTLLLIVSLFGMTKLKDLGYVLDDVPKGDKLYQDLAFFQDNFKGIMPFEMIVNTKKKNGLLNLKRLEQIEQLEDTIKNIPEFSDVPLSIVDVVKFARQSFYFGDSSKYGLLSPREEIFMLPYIKRMNTRSNIGSSLMDKNMQVARISAKLADVGTVRLDQIVKKLNSDAVKIFPGKDVDFKITGYSFIFMKGNKYLLANLIWSLALAIGLIIVVIVILFRSARLVLIALIPNFLALIITGGIMGFFGIHLKPSTVLVFSIAFGIAIDASFHFLVRYRQDLKRNNWDISTTVSESLHRTGFSVVYTSLVLFFGFGIFCFSNFGSTVALGALTAITLLCAMFTNIILIPALLLSFDKTKKV
jgi:predicted RND superfamily exporter protein